jgi:hypothetical protein
VVLLHWCVICHPHFQVGDASALNGSFKMELYRAKQEYLKYRTSMKFEATDIIPLLNKSWVKSFGNVESAKKAIAHRGWNPLNWNLLDHLPEEDVVDLTQHQEEAPSLPPLPPINVTKGVGSYYVDKILEEQQKDAGRKKRFDDIKKECDTREKKILHLKQLTKILSSVLAASNHYVLDDNVLERVEQKHRLDEAAKTAAQDKQ